MEMERYENNQTKWNLPGYICKITKSNECVLKILCHYFNATAYNQWKWLVVAKCTSINTFPLIVPLSGYLAFWALDPNMKSDMLLKTPMPRWWLWKKPCVSEQKAPRAIQAPGDEPAKGGWMAVTQRNCQKKQQMMDFINDHFSNAYICFKGLWGGQSHKRAVFKSVGQRDLGYDEILVSPCRKVNVTHRTC